MELKVINGGAALKVSEETFGKEFNQSLVHQVVTAYRNAGRSGTKAQLTKAEVRGGGRKPRPQKGGGTSRARPPHPEEEDAETAAFGLRYMGFTSSLKVRDGDCRKNSCFP